MIKNIIILILSALVWFAYTEEAYSANQEDQYCDIKTTLIRTVDEKGKVISEKNEETVQCDDGYLFLPKKSRLKKPPENKKMG